MRKTFLLASFLPAALFAQQASITLRNSDVSYCYKQDTQWTITKTNDSGYPTAVKTGTTVNWTVDVQRGAAGPKTLCALGFVTITNTGTAKATIGNIIVNIQRQSQSKWRMIAADVATASAGDAATSANMVADSLQTTTVYGPQVTTSGAAATFNETPGVSGALEFTDANSNTVWSLNPQKTIAVGESVSLICVANFNVDSLSPALGVNEQIRTEVFVSFGNAGARGGSGASAQNIDIDGNGNIGGDEKYVRTVPTRVTKAVPPLQVCNDQVTVTDVFSTATTASYALTLDEIGTGKTTKVSATYHMTGTVAGTGLITNTASLDGTGSTVPITIVDPVTGISSTTNVQCCAAVALDASSSVLVYSDDTPPPAPQTACSYTQGAFNDKAKGAPAQLLTTYWPSIAPLTIGTTPTYYAEWTSSGLSAFRTYVGGGGPSGALTVNTSNATSTSGGTLPKQVATLSANLKLGTLNAFTPYSGIGGLQLFGTGTSLDGKYVYEILAIANTALGTGVLPDGFTFASLNDLITNLNESWDNCSQSAWALSHLK